MRTMEKIIPGNTLSVAAADGIMNKKKLHFMYRLGKRSWGAHDNSFLLLKLAW